MKKVSKKKTYTRKKKTYTRRRTVRKSRSKHSRTRSYKQRGGLVENINEAIRVIKGYDVPHGIDYLNNPHRIDEVHIEYEGLVAELETVVGRPLENIHDDEIEGIANYFATNRVFPFIEGLEMRLIALANSIEGIQQTETIPMEID